MLSQHKYLDLYTIKKCSEQILLDNKGKMEHALRYMGKGFLAPRKIEKFVKHYYLYYPHLECQKEYSSEGVLFVYTLLEEGKFVLFSDNIEYNICLSKDDQGLLIISYAGNIYKELPYSGNAYAHTKSQEELVKKWSLLDLNAGILTEWERESILILNDIHDIPEGYVGDMITALKTDEHRNYENTIFQEKILKSFPQHYHEYISDLEQYLDTKYSLFKLYERLIYVVYDTVNFETHKHYIPDETYYLLRFLLVAWIFILDKEWQLPDGSMRFGKDIPSVYVSFKENEELITKVFVETEKYFSDRLDTLIFEHKKYGISQNFYEIKAIWENFLSESSGKYRMIY